MLTSGKRDRALSIVKKRLDSRSFRQRGKSFKAWMFAYRGVGNRTQVIARQSLGTCTITIGNACDIAIIGVHRATGAHAFCKMGAQRVVHLHQRRAALHDKLVVPRQHRAAIGATPQRRYHQHGFKVADFRCGNLIRFPA